MCVYVFVCMSRLCLLLVMMCRLLLAGRIRGLERLLYLFSNSTESALSLSLRAHTGQLMPHWSAGADATCVSQC